MQPWPLWGRWFLVAWFARMVTYKLSEERARGEGQERMHPPQQNKIASSTLSVGVGKERIKNPIFLDLSIRLIVVLLAPSSMTKTVDGDDKNRAKTLFLVFLTPKQAACFLLFSLTFLTAQTDKSK